MATTDMVTVKRPTPEALAELKRALAEMRAVRFIVLPPGEEFRVVAGPPDPDADEPFIRDCGPRDGRGD